ncbi:MAG TPA: zinc-ribbon domain-containing protein [Ktedonobacteraceae bacterium]|nr:zinc-ribbon domain-containing protein [Ktedonobacteraceae bacterium]
MSDFVESAKNMVSAAVSRTSWQAQKQLRVRSKQTEIDQLFEQRQKLLDELAEVAMNLYQQNKLTDQQLTRLCASIQELDHDMQNREAQLQDIKNEMYPASQLAPAPTTNYAPPSGYVPPTQGGQSAPGAGSQPRPQPQTQICPNCGNPVRPNALYCRSCGAKLR